MADLTPEQQATLDRWNDILAGKNGPQPDNTYVGNPDDAYSFYQFRNGLSYRMSCPIGLVFNPAVNPGPICDWPQNVSLDDNPAPR